MHMNVHVVETGNKFGKKIMNENSLDDGELIRGEVCWWNTFPFPTIRIPTRKPSSYDEDEFVVRVDKPNWWHEWTRRSIDRAVKKL